MTYDIRLQCIDQQLKSLVQDHAACSPRCGLDADEAAMAALEHFFWKPNSSASPSSVFRKCLARERRARLKFGRAPSSNSQRRRLY